jgi:hypothetical protein
MLNVNELIGFGVGGVTTLSFVASNSVDATTITYPVGTQVGDIAYLFDMPARGVSGTPMPVVTPTGWTFLASCPQPSSNNVAIFVSAKVVTDVSEVITGANFGTTSGYRRKILLVFRGGSTFSSALSLNGEGTSGTPATQTVIPDPTNPIITFAAWRGTTSISTRGFAPSADQELSSGTTVYVRYLIQNSNSQTVSVTMSGGGDKCLQSFYIKVQ